MADGEDRWLDDDAGPVVRPYAVTRGRTQPAGETAIGLIDVVVLADPGAEPGVRLTPEHRRIIRLCQRPVTVVDLASDLGLPIGVVRVLLADLSGSGILLISPTVRPNGDERLLRKVLDGLRSL